MGRIYNLKIGTGATPLFEDDFESYTLDENIIGEGDSTFTWSASAVSAGSSVTVSNDVSHSGSKSLKFLVEGSGGYEDCEQRFILTDGLSELWMEYWMYFSSVYHRNNSNQKFLVLWPEEYDQSQSGGKPSIAANVYPDDAATNRLECYRTVPSGNAMWPQNTVENLPWLNHTDFIDEATDLAKWIRMRWYLKVATYGFGDGIIQMWKDSTLVFNSSVEWLYDSHDNLTNYYRKGYLWGNNNGGGGNGYSVDTAIYFDDFKIYSSNPGW